MSYKENTNRNNFFEFIEFIEKQNPDEISMENWRKIIWDIQEKNDFSIHLKDIEQKENEKEVKFDNVLQD